MNASDNLLNVFRHLLRETNKFTSNPLLNSFSLQDLEEIEEASIKDPFLARKKQLILSHVKNLNISLKFDERLKSAFDEYSEATLYILLKNKFPEAQKVSESSVKSPDFRIPFKYKLGITEQSFEIYAELKALAFSDNNLNYNKAIEDGYKANQEIEEKLGRGVAMAITEIQPLRRSNGNNDPYSIKSVIETVIQKIEQNLKPAQFSVGETVLIVNLKQLCIPSKITDGGVPVYIGGVPKTLISGVQWHVAFGKIGNTIFKSIDFEGQPNIEGQLDRDGILVNRNWIKGICFLEYGLPMAEGKPEISGFMRDDNDSDAVSAFLHTFCDFVNDDRNSFGYKNIEGEEKIRDNEEK